MRMAVARHAKQNDVFGVKPALGMRAFGVNVVKIMRARFAAEVLFANLAIPGAFVPDFKKELFFSGCHKQKTRQSRRACYQSISKICHSLEVVS